MFGDGTAFIAHSSDDVQKIVSRCSDSAKNIRLEINIKTTGMMYQPVLGSKQWKSYYQNW